MAKSLQNSITETTLTDDLSLEAEVFVAFIYRTPNRFKLLDKLVRANVVVAEELTDKTIYLSEKAKKLLKYILKQFFRGETVLLNNKYITKVTRCKAAQNKNILDELANILDIKYFRLLKKNGVYFSYNYHFQLHPTILSELRLTSHQDIKTMPQFIVPSYLNNRNSFNERIRSSESNFLQNSISLVSEENLEPEEVVENKTSVVGLPRKRPIANARRKPTNQERKARVYSPKFKQYDTPKSLADLCSLSSEDCAELRRRSGRSFSDNAIKEILLDMSRRLKESKHRFPSRAAFMAYMTKALQYEKRDAVKTAGIGFKILTRATEAEIIQHVTQSEREAYFNSVEQQAITHRSDENQYRAKLANRLKPSQAYDFLSSLGTVKKNGTILELYLTKKVDLTEHSLETILQEANAVGGYNGVDEYEICVK